MPPKSARRQRLGQQLRDQVPAGGADRQPDRHLARACRGAREQQVRDVRAGNQQYESGHAHQHAEGRSRDRRRGALPVSARIHRDGLAPEPAHGLVAHVLLQRRLDVVDDRVVLTVQRGARRFDRDIRFQSREEVRPVDLAIVPALEAGLHVSPHGDRHEHFRPRPQRRPLEAPRRHADNRQRLSVDDELLVERVGICREPAQPVGMAQNGHMRFTDRPVVFRSDEAAQRRRQLEHREIAARHQHSRSAERLSLIGEVRAEDPMRGHAGEGRLHALEVAKHRVAEDLVAVARLIARVRAGLGTGRREVDQPIRLGHRQRLEEDLVETGKDRGVRADTERQ